MTEKQKFEPKMESWIKQLQEIENDAGVTLDRGGLIDELKQLRRAIVADEPFAKK